MRRGLLVAGLGLACHTASPRVTPVEAPALETRATPPKPEPVEPGPRLVLQRWLGDPPLATGGPARWLAVDRGGRTALVAVAEHGRRGPVLHAWDLAAGHPGPRLGETPLVSFAATPDASLAVLCDGEGTLEAWDVPTATRRASWSVGEPAWVAVRDDEVITAGWTTGTIRRFSFDGATRGTIRRRTEATALAVDPSSDRIAVGTRLGRVELWSPNGRRPQRVLGGGGARVTLLSIDERGQGIAAAQSNLEVRAWALPSGDPIGRIRSQGGSVMALELLPGGRRAVISHSLASTAVSIWDLPNGQPEASLPPFDRPPSALASYDGGTRLLVGTDDGQLLPHALVGPTALRRGHVQALRWVAFLGPTTVLSEDRSGRRLRWGTDGAFVAHPEPAVPTLAVASSGRMMLEANSSAGMAPFLHHLPARPDQPEPVPWRRTEVRHAAFSGDDARLALSDGMGDAFVLDVVALSPPPLTEPQRWRLHSHGISALALSYDGQHLATAGDVDERVRLWGLGSGRPALLFELPRRIPGVTELRFDRDGGLLVASPSDELQRWTFTGDAPQVAELFEGTGLPLDHPMSLAVSLDGRWLASGHLSGAVRLWSLPAGELLDDQGGHAGPVSALAFDHTGDWLVSGDWLGGLRLWRLR